MNDFFYSEVITFLFLFIYSRIATSRWVPPMVGRFSTLINAIKMILHRHAWGSSSGWFWILSNCQLVLTFKIDTNHDIPITGRKQFWILSFYDSVDFILSIQDDHWLFRVCYKAVFKMATWERQGSLFCPISSWWHVLCLILRAKFQKFVIVIYHLSSNLSSNSSSLVTFTVKNLKRTRCGSAHLKH